MSCDPVFLALLRAVLESPDDDAPRLVLADWHDEQGDDWNQSHAAAIRRDVAACWRSWRMPGR